MQSVPVPRHAFAEAYHAARHGFPGHDDRANGGGRGAGRISRWDPIAGPRQVPDAHKDDRLRHPERRRGATPKATPRHPGLSAVLTICIYRLHVLR